MHFTVIPEWFLLSGSKSSVKLPVKIKVTGGKRTLLMLTQGRKCDSYGCEPAGVYSCPTKATRGSLGSILLIWSGDSPFGSQQALQATALTG